ncbi:MAG TPA: GYD domain-containing protein [Candidatus Limnocylindria bacterium]|nr:GYD domain-containing protein [Candidatus Limnocylindria bacterium]
MARYITLLHFTEQGVRKIKESADRALAFKQDAEKLGVTVESQLWTMGRCDGVLILTGEEKLILRCLTQLASLGNVRTETLRAFNADELKAIAGP